MTRDRQRENEMARIRRARGRERRACLSMADVREYVRREAERRVSQRAEWSLEQSCFMRAAVASAAAFTAEVLADLAEIHSIEWAL